MKNIDKDQRIKDVNKVPYMIEAAAAYLEIVTPLYDRFNKSYINANVNGEDSVPEHPSLLSPLISNISFSIELLLKALSIQVLSTWPRKQKHDLVKLWEPFNSEQQDVVNKAYRHELKRWDNSINLKFVSFSKEKTDTKLVDKPSDNISEALYNLNGSFERWRYMYELQELEDDSLCFNFAEAYCVSSSLLKVTRFIMKQAEANLCARSNPTNSR